MDYVIVCPNCSVWGYSVGDNEEGIETCIFCNGEGLLSNRCLIIDKVIRDEKNVITDLEEVSLPLFQEYVISKCILDNMHSIIDGENIHHEIPIESNKLTNFYNKLKLLLNGKNSNYQQS